MTFLLKFLLNVKLSYFHLFVYYIFIAPKLSSAKLSLDHAPSINANELIRFKEIVNSFSPVTCSQFDYNSKATGEISITDELLQRKKIVNSYLADFEKVKKSWIEPESFYFKTYKIENSHNLLQPNLPENSLYQHKHRYPNNEGENLHKMMLQNHKASVQSNVANCINDRKYAIRWLKKLSNKLNTVGYEENHFVIFKFNNQFLKNLEEVSSSSNFNIEAADELIISMISNSTNDFSDNNYFTNKNYKWFHFNINMYNSLLIVSFIIIVYMFYKSMKMHPVCTSFIVLFIFAVFWNAYKMYKIKIAEKHAILARTPSDFCASTLTKNSGLLDHIKHNVFYSFYNDECKKYYEGLMVDPWADLNIFVVVADLVSATFFQMFNPFSKAINSFIKETFYDMSYIQITLTLILIIVTLLIYFRYKLKFPFWLGSLEPTSYSVGSRVEDLKLPNPENILNISDNLSGPLNINEEMKVDDNNIDTYSEVHTKEYLNSNTPLTVSNSKQAIKNMLKLCPLCNEILLIHLDCSNNEEIPMYNLKQLYSTFNHSELCHLCSEELQTIICENELLEYQNIPLKIVSSPCVHLRKFVL